MFTTGSVVGVRGRPTVRRYTGGGTYDQMTLASFLAGQLPAAGEEWTRLNGDETDDRAGNLRLQPQGLGRRNAGVGESNARRAAERRETGQLVGVRKHGERYSARIAGPAHQMQPLGEFAAAEEAGRAYGRARAELGLPAVDFPEDTTA